jgi:hypothetical protein
MTLQFRRGTDSDRLTITPAVGEPIYTTDTKSLYIGDGSTAGGTLVTGSGGTDSATVSAIITTTFGAIDTDLIPNGDAAYDLGNASNQWRDLYLSGTSLHLGGHKIVKDGNTIKFTDSAGATINVTAGNVASSLIDSSDVTSIITAGGYTTYDSTNAAGQITTAINNLVDAAPASLDTLNELAAALNDDANFAATITGQIAALPDSAQVATIVTSYGYTTYDSGNTTGLIDSAYVQARQTAQDFAYSSLTGVPNVLDSADVVLIAQANDTTRDSAFVTGIIDSDYINARVSATDSATVSAIITADVDAAFINALTIGADSLGGQAPSYYLDYNNFTNTPTIYDSGNFTGQLAAASTSNLSEGTNLYYTTVRADSDAKAAISVTDAGGDGSLTYNSGVITYTGPSASEVRAHFTAGTGVTISSGQVSIGQAVATSDSVTFSGLTVSGNLTVNGTTTTINTSTYAVTDPLIRLADSNETSDIVDIGFIGHYFGDGASRHTGFFRDASNSQYYIFNGLIDTVFDSTNPPNVINRGGTDFTLATLNVGTIVGQYDGFDSDVTAAGLATQTYVTNAVAALPDSAQVATIVTSYGYSTYDSGNFTGQLTVATGSSVLAYDANLQSFVTAFTLPTSDGTTGQVLQTNGSGTLSFVTQSGGTDSATVSSIVTSTVDSAYIQLRDTPQDFAYSSLTGAPTNVSSFTNDAGYTTYDSANTTGMLSTYATQTYVDNAVAALPDSAQVATIVTSYGYSTYDSGNFTGQLTAATGTSVLSYDANLQGFVDAFTLPTSDGTTNQVLVTNGSGTISFADQSGGLDSAAIINLIDSAYVAAREADVGGGGGTTQQTFKTIAISGQSDVVADDSADTLTLVAGTGITLTTDAGTDTITITASGGGGGGLDSAAANTLIDAKIQVLDVTDLVGADGNAGQLLKSLGNGETEWTDLKLSDYKPTSATASGSKGEITYDSAHLYVCIATNSWRRIIWTDSSW